MGTAPWASPPLQPLPRLQNEITSKLKEHKILYQNSFFLCIFAKDLARLGCVSAIGTCSIVFDLHEPCTESIKSSHLRMDSPTEQAARAELNSFTFCRVASEVGLLPNPVRSHGEFKCVRLIRIICIFFSLFYCTISVDITGVATVQEAFVRSIVRAGNTAASSQVTAVP